MRINIEEVKSFIGQSSKESRIYLGADSIRFKNRGVWFAEYTLAVVIHRDGSKGCKIFGDVQVERDYDTKKNKPVMRLMSEVYKIAELYGKLEDVLHDRYVEVHLDINPSELYGSNCVLQQAIGYIKGTCGVVPMVKPDSPAASFCADRLVRILDEQREAA